MKRLQQNIKKQVILFFYALSYFTRIPIPAFVVFDNKQFYKANAYFPLIGVIVAFSMAGFLYLCLYFFSVPISLILMLVISLLLTGALHEDGFADCSDGLGGGYDTAQRLKIMKDSQIGSYGGIALVVLFLLKFQLLSELAAISFELLFIALFVAHVVSRYGALCLMQTMPYVRLSNEGKVEALSQKIGFRYFMFASFSLVCILMLPTMDAMLLVLLATILASLLLRYLFLQKLAGYTGDCLGFTQQCLELLILLLLTTKFAL